MSNVDSVKAKSTPIELDGGTYHLKFDLNAFAELEEKYGSLREALKALGGEEELDEEGKPIIITVKDKDTGIERKVPSRKVSIKGLRAIFWAGLLHENPKMSEREAGALLNISDMTYLATKLTEAIKAAMPKPDIEGTEEATAGGPKNLQGPA